MGTIHTTVINYCPSVSHMLLNISPFSDSCTPGPLDGSPAHSFLHLCLTSGQLPESDCGCIESAAGIYPLVHVITWSEITDYHALAQPYFFPYLEILLALSIMDVVYVSSSALLNKPEDIGASM